MNQLNQLNRFKLGELERSLRNSVRVENLRESTELRRSLANRFGSGRIFELSKLSEDFVDEL